MFECKDLEVCISGKVNHYNFYAKKGQITVILGLNGIGKTTLLKNICGISKPQNGKILFDNTDITHAKNHQLITYLPQKTNNLNELTVLSYVLTARTPYLGMFDNPNEQDYKIARACLEMCEVDHFSQRILHTLSGGEHKKVSIAKAFCQQTKILVLDEPTAYLDFKSAYDFMEKIQTYTIKNNITTILTLHDPNLALEYTDNIIFLDENGINIQLPISHLDVPKQMEQLYGRKIKNYVTK